MEKEKHSAAPPLHGASPPPGRLPTMRALCPHKGLRALPT